MTVREVIHIITDEYAKGIPSDDTTLRPRRVYAALRAARSRVLSDAIRKHGVLNELNYTTLPCVGIEKVEAHECSCIPIAGCHYFRSTCKLPDPLADFDESLTDVATYDGSIRFSRIDFARINYAQSDRYTAKSPKYFIRNGYLYLINVPKLLKTVLIRMAAVDPTDVSCSICHNQQTCVSPLDLPFAADEKYILPIVQLAGTLLFKTNTRNDAENNNQGEPLLPVQKG